MALYLKYNIFLSNGIECILRSNHTFFWSLLPQMLFHNSDRVFIVESLLQNRLGLGLVLGTIKFRIYAINYLADGRPFLLARRAFPLRRSLFC